MKLSAPAIIQKHIPKPTKGVLPTSMVYIGVDTVFTFTDNVFGSPLQKLGANLPILGRLSIKDVLTYMSVARGFKFNTDTLIAFFINKFLSQGISSTSQIRGIISPIVSQPGGISTSSGQSSSVSQGVPL